MKIRILGITRPSDAPESTEAGFTLSMRLRKSELSNAGGRAKTVGSKLINDMVNIYSWLDECIKSFVSPETCFGCGRCCDYENFGHRIFITTPEILYLQNAIDDGKLVKDFKISTGKCPFLAGGTCSVRDFRFGPCRIFFCKSSARWQNDLTEEFLGKVKQLCIDKNIEYRYVDISMAFENFL